MGPSSFNGLAAGRSGLVKTVVLWNAFIGKCLTKAALSSVTTA